MFDSLPTLAALDSVPFAAAPGLDRALGFLAGLGACVCWVATSLAFTTAGRRVGSTAVNVTRSVLAIPMLFALLWVVEGRLWPIAAPREALILAISGVIGLAIGDQLLFAAFVRLGPRLSLLIMNTAPLIVAAIAWPLLGEPIGWLAGIGIAVTLGGVAWVLLEREELDGDPVCARTRKAIGIGMLLAFGGAAGQAIGMVLSKFGMPAEAGTGAPLHAQTVRMVAGAGFLLALGAIAGATGRSIGARGEHVHESPRRRYAIASSCLVAGAILGPVLGVWFSLIAVFHLKAAIAQTIVALVPVFVLPLTPLVEKRRVTPRAILGAIIATAGVGILSFDEDAPTPVVESAAWQPTTPDAPDSRSEPTWRSASMRSFSDPMSAPGTSKPAPTPG